METLVAMRYLRTLCDAKYAEELERERSLITQASQMQTVFSVFTAAFFMALPLAVEHRGTLSLTLFFVFSSVIGFLMLASLLLASMVQWRSRVLAVPNISKLVDIFVDKAGDFDSEKKQLQQYISMLEPIQLRRNGLNERRVRLLMASMILFYAAAAAILAFFVTAVCMLLG